ncbi:MAG: M20/M25/M40 family metallo-hydrolase [Oscillospiraceae bacterium]|nr:M20/M25/M40 family metallo-hydrolase [Oscillospiraceae bacterium]
MELTHEIKEYIAAHRGEALELLKTLARIPAPSGHEEVRAEFCLDWLKKQGAKNAYIDAALNVVWPVGCEAGKEITVYVGHSDVVFPDTEPLDLKEDDARIYCPGVGDDTANAVALMMAAKCIASHGLKPCDGGVLLVINAAEEGLGNLKGTRQIMADYGERVKEFISFDSQDDSGVSIAVGSRRYRVAVETEGGHSFRDFGNRSAIAVLARLIDRLYAIKVPAEGKTTYNVGTVSGGTSVNTIAQRAEMLYEFRSDRRNALETMEKEFRAALENIREDGISLTVESVGERPCSGDVDEEKLAELMAASSAIYSRHYGKEIRFSSGSTDCNIPLSMGIPAVCVGCCVGKGAHTREEYVEKESLLPGLLVACELILRHF